MKLYETSPREIYIVDLDKKFVCSLKHMDRNAIKSEEYYFKHHKKGVTKRNIKYGRIISKDILKCLNNVPTKCNECQIKNLLEEAYRVYFLDRKNHLYILAQKRDMININKIKSAIEQHIPDIRIISLHAEMNAARYLFKYLGYMDSSILYIDLDNEL